MSQADFPSGTSGQLIFPPSPEATVFGGRGDDAYGWSPADGDVRIGDPGGIDILHLNAPSASFVFTVDGSHADLIVQEAGHTLTIEGYFQNGHIETITFSDGAEWHLDAIKGALIIETPPPPPPQAGRVIRGAAGNDRLVGTTSHDTLSGGAGNDRLDAGAGNDRLTGGFGTDILAGGTGRDVFAFGKGDSGPGASRDVITDFVRNEDRIDLTAIDADSRTRADNAFGKLLSAKQTFTDAGQMRYDARTGILSLNTDKDAEAEFEIQLRNKPAFLTLGDFVL